MQIGSLTTSSHDHIGCIRQKKQHILINEHALNREPVPLKLNRNSDVGNKQDQLPVLSQTSPLQCLTINYAPFTPKLETSSKLFS